MVDKISYIQVEDKDLDIFLELARKIWIPTFSPFIEKFRLEILYQGMYERGKIISQLKDPSHHFYFIYVNDKAKGFMALKENEQHLKLDKLYVDQDAQGKGIGKHALSYCVSKALTLGYDKVKLNVNRGNQYAVEFYRRNGFEIIESIDIPGPAGEVYDDYIMQKII